MSSDPLVLANAAYVDEDFEAALQHYSDVSGWSQLDLFLEQYLPQGEESKTAIASSFGATLEMSREGLVDLRQDEPFAPIYMRKKEPGAEWQRVG